MFNPDRQVSCNDNLRSVYFGPAPCLGVVEAAYGRDVAETWLEIALFELGEFAGVKEKMSKRQIHLCAQMILRHWKYRTWNVCEFMRFFLLFKYGTFGRFYGSVDPITILQALDKFAAVRCREIDALEQRARDERAKQSERRGITYDEWVRLGKPKQ